MSTVSEHRRYAAAAAVLNNSLLTKCCYDGVFAGLSLCIFSDVTFITVARDRDSDSERQFYFGRVIMVALCNRADHYIFAL